MIEEKNITENSLKPYWNEHYQNKIEEMFTPELVNMLQMDNPLSQQETNSWFKIKWNTFDQKSSYQSLPVFLPESTNLILIRTKKYYLKPSKEQKILLKKWMGSYRWVYNKVVHTMEKNYIENGTTISYVKGRKEWYQQFCAEAQWLVETPPNIVYEAMRNASHDYMQCVKKRAKGMDSNLPKCSYKTQRTFSVLGNTITNDGLYYRRMGKLKTSEPLPNNPKNSQVLREYNRWYLLIPQEVKKQQQTENQWRVASIDPGVRTFATVFSELGVGKFGEGSFQRIVRLAHSLDKLLGKISKAGAREKYRLKKAAKSIRRKIRDLVEDIHYQSLGYLFRNFDILIIPECDFTTAVSRIKRKIRRKSVRSLLTWAFATFRGRAISVAQRLGKKVYIVDESYTSKTANWTGEIVHNLGGSRTITSGGFRLDRDVNGALGIYLKALMGDPSLKQVA
jgi:putative transposase